jgi:hypothetical protein
MADTKDVFISSTSEDLKPYREIASKVLYRLGLRPIRMEDFTADPHPPVDLCKQKMAQAEIYLGIFANRYGWQPFGEASITEMEFDWALEKGIPIYAFILDDNHPWPGKFSDKGAAGVRLEAFKERVKGGNQRTVKFFGPEDQFRDEIWATFSPLRPEASASLHAPLDIPPKPAPFNAPDYTLLGERGLVGRQKELSLLTDWVAKTSSPLYAATLLHVVAIGGMGKSALTWKWYKDIAPLELPKLAGRIWWSFYETDGHFENFITRALAYVEGRPTQEIRKLPPPEREARLLHRLNQEPFLLVLDGLERLLNAYARLDAAHLADDDLDVKTAHEVAGIIGLPESAAESFTGQHRLRATADPRAGQFLQKLSQVKASRVLVSTRLYPADLQLITGEKRAGNEIIFLKGLSDEDALDLWRDCGASGAREALLPLLQSFENYPLLIRALAGEVRDFRLAPGNFEAWRAKKPDFNPAALPLSERKSHVLAYALAGLSPASARVLWTVSAFRGPVSYEALLALMVKEDFTEETLDAALGDLEDRGLLGWDRRANRYDLHPITRGVAWASLGQEQKQGVYAGIEGYFRAVPMKNDWQEVESLDDLAPAIELYYALIGQGRYDEAGRFFYDRLDEATLYRLSASRQRVEMLRTFFPNGTDQLPRLSRVDMQTYVLNALALAYKNSGRPGQALPLLRGYIDLSKQRGSQKDVAIGLGSLSETLRLSGALNEAESAAAKAIENCRTWEDALWEAVCLQFLGLAAAARGTPEAEVHLWAALAIDRELEDKQGQGADYASLAQAALWRGGAAAARPLADQAWELAGAAKFEQDFIRAARLQGAAALALGDLDTADERLHHALVRAKAVNLAEEELPALVGLAGLARLRGDLALAHQHLEDIWPMAEAGPYPLFHADTLVELARVELAGGDKVKARAAAERALKMAECDGGEYRYMPGVRAAEKLLKAIGGR